jgi:DNA-binding XRE family transcriptional regulator
MQSKAIQEIRLGKERAVVVPLATWEEIMEKLEELEDEIYYALSKTDPDDDYVEFDELCRRFGRCPLRYLRRHAGVTQTELARCTGLSQSFIAKVESNDKKMSPSSRKKIARALKLPEDKLVY